MCGKIAENPVARRILEGLHFWECPDLQKLGGKDSQNFDGEWFRSVLQFLLPRISDWGNLTSRLKCDSDQDILESLDKCGIRIQTEERGVLFSTASKMSDSKWVVLEAVFELAQGAETFQDERMSLSTDLKFLDHVAVNRPAILSTNIDSLFPADVRAVVDGYLGSELRRAKLSENVKDNLAAISARVAEATAHLKELHGGREVDPAKAATLSAGDATRVFANLSRLEKAMTSFLAVYSSDLAGLVQAQPSPNLPAALGSSSRDLRLLFERLRKVLDGLGIIRRGSERVVSAASKLGSEDYTQLLSWAAELRSDLKEFVDTMGPAAE